MRRLAVTLGLATVLGLSGCGGGDSKPAAPATTFPPVTTAPTTTLLRGSDEASTPFCKLAKTYSDKSDAIAASITDPAKLKVAATDAEAAIRQAQPVAPAAIKADVAAVAKTAGEVLAGLKRNDYMFAKTPEITKVQDPAFQKSITAVLDYARIHCGVG